MWLTRSRGVPDVLENNKLLAKGELPDDLKSTIELVLPQIGGKKAQVTLGVPSKNQGVALRSAFPGVTPITPAMSPLVATLFRGLREHYTSLIENVEREDMDKIALASVSKFSYSRVKYSALRDDKHIIAAIATIDTLDKGLNTFSMRLREWYGAHFPELITVVSDNLQYAKLVSVIGDKKTLSAESVDSLADHVGQDGAVAQAIVDAARVSVGVDLADEDLAKMLDMAERVTSMFETRSAEASYLERKLSAVAPNLQTVLGTVMAARLISKGGSLSELAKKPASTLQILGAEKALFRALKTKGPTPKYGILYHSGYISKAKPRDKGRMSRYVANKSAIASRIDAFTSNPTNTYGLALKKQIEERLEFYDTGKKPTKNADVMVSLLVSYCFSC